MCVFVCVCVCVWVCECVSVNVSVSVSVRVNLSLSECVRTDTANFNRRLDECASASENSAPCHSIDKHELEKS